MYKIKSLVAIAFFGLFSLNALASWEEASARVETATIKMQALLASTDSTGESSVTGAGYDQFQQSVAEILNPVVDFERISRGVMAKHYRNATDEQKSRFADVFQGTLIKTYAKTLAAFKFEKYEVLPNRQASTRPDRQVVQVDVLDDRGRRFHLVYYVLKGEQGWKVTNVVLDGINLRQVFKTQFSEAVHSYQGNLDGVINDWKELVTDSEGGRPAPKDTSADPDADDLDSAQ